MDSDGYKRRIEREKKARREAEQIAEEKTRELFYRNRELKELNDGLESQVQVRTAELEEANLSLRQKAQQLEEANRYKDEFLANVSHELRTPLNSMLVLARTLAGNKEKNLTRDQVDAAKVIMDSGKDLLQLIGEILDLSRIQAGKLGVVEETVYLQDLSRYLLKMFKPLAKQKKIAFQASLDAELPDSIVTDAQRLQQILKNLLGNAIKFTEEGHVRLGFEMEDEDILRVSVEDTGIGIPEEKQQLIFEAFTQADGSTTRNYGGTGLGLTISNKLASLLGGKLEVTSQIDKGSCFTLVLPLKQPQEENLPETQEESEDPVADNALTIEASEKLQGTQVLLVDDDLRAGFALSKFLQQLGVKVSIADNGRFGLRKLLEEDNNFDLVILDIMMPIMDGYDVLNELQQAPSTQQVPIIVASAKAYPEDQQKALDSGAAAFLSKPLDLEQLVSLMESLLP
ncbi:ATP-binding protein [Endozoicomonadaceae bacterium StTr2]